MKLQSNFTLLLSICFLLIFAACKKEKDPKIDVPTEKEKDKEIFLNNVTWSKIKTGPFEGVNVTSTARFNGKFYVSTARGIYSSNDGKNYSFMQKLDNFNLIGIELHQHKNELFAFSQGSDIFRFENNTWKKITISGLTTPLKNSSNQMLTNEAGDIYVFSGDNVGDALLFKSTDEGKNWEEIVVPSGTFSAFQMYNKTEILLLSKTGIMHSTDDGKNWQTAASGYSSLDRFFVHPDGLQMIMYDTKDNQMITGTLDNLQSVYCSFGNNQLIGYNNTGYIFTSDISDGNNEHIKFSSNNGKSWLALGVIPKFLTQATVLGGSVLGVMENSLIYLEDGAVTYKLFGCPTLPIADFVKKDKKIIAVGQNTMVYISNDEGNTWEIGSVKHPFSAAKCLYIDTDNSIWIGTTSGLFVVDAYASSVLANVSFNIQDYYVTAIDRNFGYTIIGLSHKDERSGYIALARDKSITKYDLYQIYGKQNFAISYVEVSYMSNSLPNFKVSIYAPNQSVWYDCYSTLNGNVITDWETTKNDYFDGNAFLKAYTNLNKAYTLRLYQGNNYEIGAKNRTPTKGKFITQGKFTNFWIDDNDYGWALIDGFLNKSSGELVSE